MNNVISSFKRLKILFLLFFPLFFFFVGTYFRTILGNLSLRSVDPDYVYFSNGLQVSLGSFNTGNIFHPGSPLQYFIALIFRITYFLRSPEIPYLDDIFTNPDLYMSIVSYSVIGILTITIFISGFLIFRITNSLLYGILIQTITFLPVIWYDLIGRVTPEVFQAFFVLALSILIIKYYWEEKPIESIYSIFLFAIIIALGLSTKVTFLPLMIIPFLTINGWRKKLLFVVITILLFLVISISVLLKIETFWDWIKNIFIHSGDYGGGESNIVDLNLLKSNFINLTQLEIWFFKMIVLSFLTLLFYLVIMRRKTERRLVLYTSSVLLTIFVQLIIVCKHFAHRNFIPSLLLLPLVVFFSLEILKKGRDYKMGKLFTQIILIVFIIVTVKNQFSWLPIKVNAMGSDIENRMSTWHVAQTLEKDSYKIIASQNYGCPFIEYTLMYSTVWASHKKQEEYKPILARLYPDTYNFFTWDNSMRYWGEKFNAQKVTESGKKVYLYLERNEEELYTRTISKLQEENGSAFKTENDTVFLNDKTGEIILRLLIQPEQVDSLIH